MTELDKGTLQKELEGFGESSPTDEELAILAQGLEEYEDADVATLAALVGLSTPVEDAELSEMGQARAWRKVEKHLGEQPAAPAASGTRRSWPMVALGLAAAAAVTFIIVRPGADTRGSSDQHELAVAMQTQTRQGLAVLGVKPGSESARAQDMLADYEQRMSEEGAG
jgi:hypothetical protein